MCYYISYMDETRGNVITYKTSEYTEKNLNFVSYMLLDVYNLWEEAKEILAQGNINKRYNTRYIPKKSGKMRRVDEPDKQLKDFMRRVVDVFVNKTCLMFPQAAFAYIKGRNTKQMAEAHKGQKDYVLKLDISDFFTNCTLEFILNAMSVVYPFSVMDITVLEVIVKACMLKYNGEYGLPQGAPTSPLLSNIAMIPVDYELQRMYKSYTRYADDIYISFRRRNKSMSLVEREVKYIIKKFNPKFCLNKDKTRLVELKKASGVWITGIMLNKDDNITIGYKTKKKLKAIIWNFLMDAKNGKHWPEGKLHKMLGNVGYWRYVEPQYVEKVIRLCEQKTGMNYRKEIKNICSK